jgi:hypothetical protein
VSEHENGQCGEGGIGKAELGYYRLYNFFCTELLLYNKDMTFFSVT